MLAGLCLLSLHSGCGVVMVDNIPLSVSKQDALEAFWQQSDKITHLFVMRKLNELEKTWKVCQIDI